MLGGWRCGSRSKIVYIREVEVPSHKDGYGVSLVFLQGWGKVDRRSQCRLDGLSTIALEAVGAASSARAGRILTSRLKRALDDAHQNRSAKAFPEVIVHRARHSGAAELVSPRRCYRNEGMVGCFDARPQHEYTRIPLLETALDLANHGCPAIQEHDVVGGASDGFR